MQKIKFFIDFDGTITQEDVVDMILSRFASDGWHDIEDAWVRGEMGSRECLEKQMNLVKASKDEFENLLSTVKVDPYFFNFLKTTHQLSIPTAIVSDGFDTVIEAVLKNSLRLPQELLDSVSIYSNHLVWENDRLRLEFSNKKGCAHGCGNCKPRIMSQLSGKDDFTVFVGDGHSDRFAAKQAMLTFAKNELLEICQNEGIEHKAYMDFSQIEEWLLSQIQGSPRAISSGSSVIQATG